jgi:NitT/TauT family transport system substrate-binding protein
MRKILVLILATLSFSLAQAQEHKLVFATHWLPQAQFAGFYVAKDKGFYKEAGLDVDIIHPSASVPATEFLKDGRADIISLFLITAINNRQKGLDLVNIAQLSQHSAILFVSKKTSGINSLAQFNGKKIGIWFTGFDEVPKAMVKNNNVQVKWVPILTSVNLFMMGGIDIMTVMWYNEYDQIYLSGMDRNELNTFFLSDYGFDIPEDGLYVMRKTASSRKNDLKAFVEATLKGWEYAAANKEYTIDLVLRLMQEAKVPATRAHQKWMLDRVLELQNLKGKKTRLSGLDPDDFKKALGIMRDHYNANFPIEYGDFFQPALTVTPK